MEALHSPRQSRSAQILRTARELFLAHGWERFGIDAIAEALDCSRPLIYKHFSCKEEILVTLAVEAKQFRAQMYERAVMLPWRAREKAIAIGVVESFLLDHDLPIELTVATTSLRLKTSRERQESMRMFDVRSMTLATSVIREAMGAGELRLPSSLAAEDLLFFLWSARWGASSLMVSDFPLPQAGVRNPGLGLELSLSLVLDGYGWRPLSTEWDYKETLRRAREEVFPPSELERLLDD